LVDNTKDIDELKKEPMFCVNCGSKINPENNFCTQCGISSKNNVKNTNNSTNYKSTNVKNKKRKLSTRLKISAGIGIFFVFLIFLGAISNNNSDVDNQENASHQISSIGEKDNPAKVGDSIVVGDIAYKITATSITHNVGGDLFGENADGVFIIVDMEMENRGTKSVQMLSNYFKLVDSKGREFETDNGAWIHLENNVFLKQLQPSLPTNGQIIFDVPTTTESYMMEIDGILFNNDKKYITLGQYN
jgi:hypothetical protein